MNRPDFKYAKEIKAGDSIVEVDGSLLRVAKVVKNYRQSSIVEVQFEQDHMTPIKPQKFHGLCPVSVVEGGR